MKIKNIKVYKIDIPLKEGAYKWAHNNKVEKFENEADAGDITFRIEHIVKIDLSKGDPFILENSKEAPEM